MTARSCGMSSFLSTTPFLPAYPTALAIYCSDGRFTDAVEELLHHLGHKRLDVLTLPGGPALLNPWSASPVDADHVARSAQFLIKAHGITEVVLLAHAGCGYYKTRFPMKSAAEIVKSQIDDLAVAARSLDTAKLKTHRYWAEPQGGKVRFDLVAAPI